MINNNIKIGIIANDLRQVYMAKMLANINYNINIICSAETDKERVYNIMSSSDNDLPDNLHISTDINDLVYESKILVCPVPFEKVSEFITIPRLIKIMQATQNKILYAGMIDGNYKHQLQNADITFCDYMDEDDISIFNSVATAEGIIAEAIINSDINLHNSKCLVTGYGKCAKTLAHKLAGLGASVTVASRNPKDIAAAESFSYSSANISNLKDILPDFDFIFNTVPAKILDDSLLNCIKNNCLILDIASLPGCTNKAAVKKLNLKYIHSLGIPGRYAPKSSGEAIGYKLINYINEHLLLFT